MIFIISDTHFYHGGIINYCNRPFKGIDEMNRYMIARWQERVTDNDIVYHLGDVTFRGSKTQELLSQLPGIKRLIVGNHDDRKVRNCNLWQMKSDSMTIDSDDGRLISLTHFPPEFPDPGFIHLHGHTHMPTRAGGAHHDVGVDAQPWVDYGPVPLKEMLKRCLA